MPIRASTVRTGQSPAVKMISFMSTLLADSAGQRERRENIYN
jgi:hypothetical protein